MADATPPADKWQRCSRCNRRYPLSSFDTRRRKRGGDQRPDLCRRCWNAVASARYYWEVVKPRQSEALRPAPDPTQAVIEDALQLRGRESRSGPPVAQKAHILNVQNGRCFYCAHRFGSTVWRPRRPNSLLRIEWDHVLPWTFCLSNYENNYVAACQVCNGLKSSLIFTSAQEAVTYIQAKWIERGYKVPSEVTVAKMPRFAK